MKSRIHVTVVGAGAFGGWTALYLLRAGARVTLLDAWGPGNSRASSGGETRVIRGTYGADSPYTEMTGRAFPLWRKHEKEWKRQMLVRTGVLWMAASGDDTFERRSIEMLRAAKIKYRELSSREMSKRWPQINFEGVSWGIYEPESGYLTARTACRQVRGVDPVVVGLAEVERPEQQDEQDRQDERELDERLAGLVTAEAPEDGAGFV